MPRRPEFLKSNMPSHAEFLKSIGLNNRFKTDQGLCPNAEIIQKKIMQFTTNQKDVSEMKVQAQALKKTIKFFT